MNGDCHLVDTLKIHYFPLTGIGLSRIHLLGAVRSVFVMWNMRGRRRESGFADGLIK